MGRALALIEQEVSTIKVRIAGDFRYPAKILYAFEIRIQRWLNLCEQQEDRSTINDSIIDMDQVMEQILHSSLTIDLPLVFTTQRIAEKRGRNPHPHISSRRSVRMSDCLEGIEPQECGNANGKEH